MAFSNIDRTLLQKCLDRAPNAWQEFSDRFIGLVIHVVHQTAASRGLKLSDEARDDLVADVFVSWIDKDFAPLRRFRGESSLASYLAVIARRVVLRRMTQLKLPRANVSLEELPAEPAARESTSLTREDLEQLESTIANLSHPEAQAVRMFHLEGKSYREISSHIGIPENSIGPFLTRAREKMRRSVS